MLIARVTAIVTCAIWLLMSAAQAAPGPYAPGKQQRQHKPAHQHQHQHQHHKSPHWNRRGYPSQDIRRHPSSQRDRLHHPPRYGEPVDHHQIYRERHQRRQGLPPSQRELHQKIQRNRHRLNRGPKPPPHVRFTRGQPLVHGSSYPLHTNQMRHLPSYPGYEWRSAGRDLLLVNIADRVIYTVIQNALD